MSLLNHKLACPPYARGEQPALPPAALPRVDAHYYDSNERLTPLAVTLLTGELIAPNPAHMGADKCLYLTLPQQEAFPASLIAHLHYFGVNLEQPDMRTCRIERRELARVNEAIKSWSPLK